MLKYAQLCNQPDFIFGNEVEALAGPVEASTPPNGVRQSGLIMLMIFVRISQPFPPTQAPLDRSFG